jgi:hypothetical protein
MACGGPGPCEAHHALCGTTYSPDEARPNKAIEGARKGKAQKSHDHFAFALHLRCHAQFHRGTGFAADMSPEQRDAWERGCVAKSRQRYAMQSPTPAVHATGKSDKRRGRPGKGWSLAGVLDLLRKEARHRPAEVSAAFTEIAALIEKDVRE